MSTLAWVALGDLALLALALVVAKMLEAHPSPFIALCLGGSVLVLAGLRVVEGWVLWRMR